MLFRSRLARRRVRLDILPRPRVDPRVNQSRDALCRWGVTRGLNNTVNGVTGAVNGTLNGVSQGVSGLLNGGGGSSGSGSSGSGSGSGDSKSTSTTTTTSPVQGVLNGLGGLLGG